MKVCEGQAELTAHQIFRQPAEKGAVNLLCWLDWKVKISTFSVEIVMAQEAFCYLCST